MKDFLAAKSELVQHWGMKTMQWSEVQRQPKEVAAAVDEDGEVCLERRGQGSLVLISEQRIGEARDGLEALARLLSALSAEHPDLLLRALSAAMPWVQFLPDKDQVAFAREFTWKARACNDLGIWGPLGRMLHAWKQTAVIHANPALAKELSRAIDADLGPVMMPTEGDAGGAGEE